MNHVQHRTTGLEDEVQSTGIRRPNLAPRILAQFAYLT